MTTIVEPLYLNLEVKECNRLLQQPTGKYRPIREFAVGRTVEMDGNIWCILEHKTHPMVEGMTKVRAVTGRVGRPKISWIPSNTEVEE